MAEKISLEELQEFFFEAGLAGFAGGGQKTAVLGLPGAKAYIYHKGRFQCMDVYPVRKPRHLWRG